MGHTAASPVSPVSLPPDLAPALRARAVALLAEVKIVTAYPVSSPDGRTGNPNRCHACHKGGVLGGHHLEDGSVVWIHRRCHRRLHRRGKGPVERTA